MTTAADMLKPLVDEMTTEKFIALCLKERGTLEGIPPEYCPVNLFAYLKHGAPCHKITPGLTACPVCSHPMCPECHNHNANQISRVTGYMSSVEGWNEGKKQELKDRKRYKLR